MDNISELNNLPSPKYGTHIFSKIEFRYNLDLAFAAV